jgi:hypothetical protein
MDNNQFLFKSFYNPKIGLVNADQFYENLKKQGLKVSRGEITKFYEQLPVNQIFKEHTDTTMNVIRSPYETVGTLQMDLMDISKFSRKNHGYKFILNIIDVWSRHVWSYAIKNKKPETIYPALDKVLFRIRRGYPHNVITITSDMGSEFKGSLNKLYDQYNVQRYEVNPRKRNG